MTRQQKYKARVLKEAVESNLDVIHDRVPASLRSTRRRLRLALWWAGRLAMPVAMLVVATGASSRPSRPDAPSPPPASREYVALDATQGEAARAIRPSPAAMHAFPPEVLALGVRRVVIDAGHGGEHPGAVSASGLTEKTITLDIAQRLAQMIVARGFEAVLTRDGDDTVSLQDRADRANAERADVFVSIHVNALERASARGVETYYMGANTGPEIDAIAERENQHAGYSLADLRALLDRVFADARREESRRLALAVQHALVGRLRETDPNVVNRGVKTAPFVVLAAAQMPAVLAEVSCLSNAYEARRLGTPEYRQLIAGALASGVTSFARVRATEQKGQDGRGN